MNTGSYEALTKGIGPEEWAEHLEREMDRERGVRYYMGIPPGRCEVCERPIGDVFVDGRLRGGPWANMCPPCHGAYGVGVGVGRGQEYHLLANGRWIKTEG